ncbi:MAG: hypothetical protein K8T89_03630 [Planctomycetes bacterium]|nr:hypothetical protein [Planctomycetota bacterium]
MLRSWPRFISNSASRPATRFADLSPRAARAVLFAFLTLATWALFTAWPMLSWEFGPRQTAYDLAVFEAIVQRVHDGQGYYDAVQVEFANFGYKTHSTFHWRQPTLFWVVGMSPFPEAFFWLLLVMSLVAVVCTVRTFLVPDCGSITCLIGVILLVGGAFSWSIYEQTAYLTAEPWCEVLILLSLCAYARGWRGAGQGAALLALSLRELVLPYCVVAAGFAWWHGRRREGIIWIASFAIYAYLLHLHGLEVTRRNPGAAASSIMDWIRPSGLKFVLSSFAINVFLRPLPPLVLALYLPIALIGLAGWPGERGRRLLLSAGVYVVAFLFLWASESWGYMYSSLLVLGLVRSPAALCDLWRSAFISRAAAVSPGHISPPPEAPRNPVSPR